MNTFLQNPISKASKPGNKIIRCQNIFRFETLVKNCNLWKSVDENDEEGKIEHKIMFEDVWTLFLQGVEFSNTDLQAFETIFFRFKLDRILIP